MNRGDVPFGDSSLFQSFRKIRDGSEARAKVEAETFKLDDCITANKLENMLNILDKKLEKL